MRFKRPVCANLCSPPLVILLFVATGDGSCAFTGYIASSSDRPPSGTNIWGIYCDGSWTDVSVTLNPINPDVSVIINPDGTSTFTVNDQYGLYHKISEDGNALMSDGDEVVAAEGVYSCGTCHSSKIMYLITGLSGVVRCKNNDLQCTLDGEGSRRVLSVSGGTLDLRGLHVHRGSYTYGGAMFTGNGANVILSIMKFTECQATNYYGGGAIYAASGTINLFAVEFSGNSASTNNGDDIYTNGADITISSTCPQGDGGTPTVGES